MKRLSEILTVVAPVLWLSSSAHAQEGTWSVSAFGGVALLRMAHVNETLEKTVTFWHQIESVPIGPFPKFSTAPVFGARVSYRYERDMAISFAVSASSGSVRNTYSDSSTTLEMDRSVGAVDLMAGLAYCIPLGQTWEFQAFLDAGFLLATADAKTFNTRVEKTGPGEITTVRYDTEANYRKTKAIAAFGSALVWNVSPLILRLDAVYRFANVGQMDGTVRRIQGTFDDLSATMFDFSRLAVGISVGYSFE